MRRDNSQLHNCRGAAQQIVAYKLEMVIVPLRMLYVEIRSPTIRSSSVKAKGMQNVCCGKDLGLWVFVTIGT
jgi:hypothetical protein